MLSAALGLAVLGLQPREVVETRCLDTWVDKNHPEANYGHDFALAVGPGAGTLVRFPLVGLAVPPNTRVVDARVEMVLIDKSRPAHVTVAEMGQDWGEGGGVGREEKVGTPGWATWKAARRGSTGWTLGIDAPHPSLDGVQAKFEGDRLQITGLASLVKEWIENPFRNHGLLLTSAENAVFGSSESPSVPRLILTVEPVTEPAPDLAILSVKPSTQGWSVSVGNLGAVASTISKVEWSGGAVDLAGVEPGQRTTVEVPFKGATGIRVVSRQDADFSNNYVEVAPDDRVAKLGESPSELVAWQRTAREMNAWMLPRSRSFAFPDGSPVRVRVEPGASGLPAETERVRALLASVTGLESEVLNASVPRRGQGWALDTRDDFYWVNGLPLPPEGVTLTNAFALPDPRLLGSADLYLLANPGALPPGPPALLLRVKDAAGDAVPEPQLEVVGSDGKPMATVKGNANGSVPLPSGKGLLPDPAHPWLTYRISKGGESLGVTLSVWEMWREASRTGKGVATIELRLPLPSAGIDRTNDLAFKRIVSDEAKRKPGALDAVVDEDAETALPMDSDAGQGWVEIDLSRDQPVAEVQLVFRGSVPDAYSISTTETGTEDQVTWVKEEMGRAQAAKWGTTAGDVTTVKVRARVRRARTVRLSLGLHQKASLVGIRVFGVAGS